MATPLNRKADTQESPAPKRSKDEKIFSSCGIGQSTMNNSVSESLIETPISSKKPSKETHDEPTSLESDNNEISNIATNTTNETEILGTDQSERKRRHEEDNNKENDGNETIVYTFRYSKNSYITRFLPIPSNNKNPAVLDHYRKRLKTRMPSMKII
jgi:hypothetical protein